MRRVILLAFIVSTYLPAFAGEADVLNVNLSCSSDLMCDFDVTVKHADHGWEHFANKWEVISPDGKILACILHE